MDKTIQSIGNFLKNQIENYKQENNIEWLKTATKEKKNKKINLKKIKYTIRDMCASR